ncbi:MAG: NAD(P)H-dependent oxidoreductase subunit E [bacterium]|nr:NAD(P)H-dependent oxidoreductase subunit E [bacterium]
MSKINEISTPPPAHDFSKLEQILNRYPREEASLIMILQDIQDEYRYLPCDVLIETAKALNLPKSTVFSVGTFYKAFSLQPMGRHNIKVCMGTACHVRGAVMVLEAFQRELGLEHTGTTEDLEFTLETVNCVGACGMAPVVVIDEKYHGEVQPDRVKKMIKKGGK